MILFDFLKYLTLEVNTNCFIKIYKFNASLWNLSIFFIIYIKEIDLYIFNL